MFLSAAVSPGTNRPPEKPTDEAACTLQALGGNRYELTLRGKFPPRWLANLTGGLATRGISVHRGHASKLSAILWKGIFELTAPVNLRPELVDFASLAQASTESTAETTLRLDSATVEKRGDDLLVEVKGPDSVGFLSQLLKLFAFYSLFPAEVEIDTPAGRVHDRFRLKGLGGSTPSDASRQGLEAALAKLLG